MVKAEIELALLLWTITGDYQRKDTAQKTGFDWVRLYSYYGYYSASEQNLISS